MWLTRYKEVKYLFLAMLLIGCESGHERHALQSGFSEVDGLYYFYTIGDWGRNGEHGQQALANMMSEAAQVVEPEFIVSTGDNFYPNGVASVHDPLWQSAFEEVYSAHSLYCDWYVVPGNHDYRGSVQAEIDYTDISRRWQMPSRYFHKDIITEDGTTVRILFVDTSPLNDEYYQEEKYQDKVAGQDTLAQLQWIDSLLSDTFDWKIVVGHHPLYTGGKRINDPNYVRNHLEPLFDKHQVTLYLAGHEHDLQHIKSEDHATHHLISGAGSEVRPTGHLPTTVFAKSIQGFLSTAIAKDSIICEFINYQGELIHRYPIRKQQVE